MIKFKEQNYKDQKYKTLENYDLVFYIYIIKGEI